MKAKKMNDAMEQLGFPDNPYWDILGCISDAIYSLIGEDTQTFDESRTYSVLNNPDLTDEERVRILLGK